MTESRIPAFLVLIFVDFWDKDFGWQLGGLVEVDNGTVRIKFLRGMVIITAGALPNILSVARGDKYRDDKKRKMPERPEDSKRHCCKQCCGQLHSEVCNKQVPTRVIN